MKTIAPLYVVAAMALAASQVHGGSYLTLPTPPTLSEALDLAADAYYASDKAMTAAEDEAEYMEWFSGVYGESRYRTAAVYWRTTADWQKRARDCVYNAWLMIYLYHDFDRALDHADDAEFWSGWSEYAASAAVSAAGFEISGAQARAKESSDKIEMLVQTLEILDGLRALVDFGSPLRCDMSVSLDQAILATHDAFTASYDAWLMALREAAYLRSLNPKYDQRYWTAVEYWSIAADYHYKACLNAYNSWLALLNWKQARQQYALADAVPLWDDALWKYAAAAKYDSTWARIAAMAAESAAGFDYYPALKAAVDSHARCREMADAVQCYNPVQLTLPSASLSP